MIHCRRVSALCLLLPPLACAVLVGCSSDDDAGSEDRADARADTGAAQHNPDAATDHQDGDRRDGSASSDAQGADAPTSSDGPTLADATADTGTAPSEGGDAADAGHATVAPWEGAGIFAASYPVPNSNVRFVAPDGSDSSQGTLQAPWQTIDHAVHTAPGGSTLVLRGGIYREGNLYVDRPFTYQPYPGERSEIRGSRVLTNWTKTGSAWSTPWSEPAQRVPADDSNLDPSFPNAAYLEMVFVGGTSLEAVASRNAVGQGKFFVDDGNHQLIIGTDPGGQQVEASTHTVGLYLNPGTEGSVVRGLKFSHYEGSGMRTLTKVTIENNTFEWNALYGLQVSEPADQAVVDHNDLSNNGRGGLNSGGSTRLLDAVQVTHNTLRANNNRHFAENWDAAGMKFGAVSNTLIADNLVEDNGAIGIWIDVDAAGMKIVGNAIYRNHGGVYHEISHDSIIAGNVIVESQVGINVSNSAFCKVFNNTLIDNAATGYDEADIVFYDYDRGAPDFGPDGVKGVTKYRRGIGTVVENNIFSHPHPAPHRMLLFLRDDALRTDDDFLKTLDFNAYHRAKSDGPPAIFEYLTNVFFAPQGASTRDTVPTLAEVRTKIGRGYEPHGIAIDGQSNPFFVDSDKGNFFLKDGSPAIGKGTALPQDVADALGWPASGSVDLGALQRPTH